MLKFKVKSTISHTVTAQPGLPRTFPVWKLEVACPGNPSSASKRGTGTVTYSTLHIILYKNTPACNWPHSEVTQTTAIQERMNSPDWMLWPLDTKNWLNGKDPDAGKDWRQEEKGATEDEMAGWHHWGDGHEFEYTLGVGDGQRSLACCSPWGWKALDMTEWLNWTAAAAKSLQSCPTLCNPIDGRPPGSPITGILEARTLEWLAISFSHAWKWKVKGKSLSRVRLLATPWITAYQAPPSMGFSRQKYWSGVPLHSPELNWGTPTGVDTLPKEDERNLVFPTSEGCVLNIWKALDWVPPHLLGRDRYPKCFV